MEGRARRILRAPGFCLGLAVVAYFAVSLALSYLRFEELATTNWDLGIFQQALWSTTHGRPFYEAGDWEFYGASSFLQVHPALLLYLIVPLYAVAPTALTLFGIQSAVVALAAVPIYLTGLRVIGRPAPALFVAALYLSSAPLLLANLYDFHLESFLPLELSGLYYLWLTGRYRWGAAVAAAACLTLEVVPFLVAAMALLFLLPDLRRTFARWRSRNLGARELRAYLARREVRWAFGLLLGAVAAYPLLRLFEWDLLPNLLGVPAVVPAPAGSGTVRSNLLAVGWDFSFSLVYKLRFWVLLFGLFAFLPALAPRTLLLSVPWFLYTIQANQISWTTLGYQYAFVPMAGISLAAIYGFRALETELLPRLARGGARARRSPRPALSRRWRPGGAGRRRAAAWVAVTAGLLAANFLLGPLDPANQNLSNSVPGYRVAYAVPPGFDRARTVSGLVPPGAEVLATTDLFPLVANDRNAYALLWTPAPPPRLPFGPAALPPYVLASSAYLFSVPGWLADRLENGSLYGLAAAAWTTPAGPVLLWQLGYDGPVRALALPAPYPVVESGRALGRTIFGASETVTGAPFPTAVGNSNATGGPFANTTPTDLPAGPYTVTFLLRLAGPAPPADAGVVAVGVSGFGGVPSSERAVAAGTLAGGGWVAVSLSFSSTGPLLAVSAYADGLLRGAPVELDEVVFAPAP